MPVSATLKRLPGRSPAFTARNVGRAQLWVSDRQLVQEIVRGSTQEIQRFMLSDIQAVQIRRTSRGLVYNVILEILLLALVLVTIYATDPLRTRVIMAGTLGTPLLAGLVVNIIRGATSRTILVTALGPQRLSSLSRFRAARRAMEILRPAIASVQGTLSPDEASRQIDASQTNH